MKLPWNCSSRCGAVSTPRRETQSVTGLGWDGLLFAKSAPRHLLLLNRCQRLLTGAILLLLPGFFPATAADLPLADGDRMVLLGDSITDAEKWAHYVTSYLILQNPDLNLHIQTEGRGGSTPAECLTTPDSSPSNERYDRRVFAYEPDWVVTMFGHSGGASKAAWKADMQLLVSEYIVEKSGALPVLVGPHPKATSDGKPILGEYEDALREIAEAAEPPYAWAPVWQPLLPVWTNPENWPLIAAPDDIHPGTAGHVVIAYAVITGAGWSTNVSRSLINADGLTVDTEDHCAISGLRANEFGGIDFRRIDARLPWAIDESGRTDAVAIQPELAGWQDYSLSVSGLAPGNYEVLIDDEHVATVPSSVLAAGWNMADLTTGPVFRQVQEVLGRIRDMHDVDRETLLPNPLPRRGVERYRSNADAAYKIDGLRGQDLIDALQPALAEIAAADDLIHETAQPQARSYSLRLVGFRDNVPPPYLPAVGIPTPAWGDLNPITAPNPSFPTTWPEGSAAGYYYIDSAHPAATDVSNPNGFPDKPRLTIPLTLPAGAMVAVANCSSQTTLTSAGTEANPIWIVGTGASLIQPRATGTYLSIEGASYVIVDGLTFDGTGTPDEAPSTSWSIRSGSHHVCLRRCAVTHMPAPPYNPTRFSSGGAGAWYRGLSTISPVDGPVSNVVVFHCSWIGNAGGQDLDYENGRHCISAAGDSDGIYRVEKVWILDNIMEDNPEDGIQLGQTANGSDPSLCRFYYIARNRISSNGENAIDLKACDQIVVSQNEMTGYRSTNYRPGAVSGSDGTACVINDDGGGPLHSWWLFNSVTDSRCAWRNQAGGGFHYLLGNLVRDLKKNDSEGEPTSTGRNGGVAYWQSASASNVQLVENTLHRVHGGIYLNNVAAASLQGNIVYDLVDSTLGWPVNINNFGSLQLSGNLYFDPDGPVRRDANALGNSDLLDVDPQFQNLADGDFTLLPTSPILDAPVSHEAIEAAYAAAFGTTIHLAHDRTAQPPGANSGLVIRLGSPDAPTGLQLAP